MSPPADGGDTWGVTPAAAGAWNGTQAGDDWGPETNAKKWGGDDAGPRGFGDENDPNPTADGPARGCFNCGEDGHNKADCTEPSRKFDGNCNICSEEGHFAKDCPTRGPMACNYCKEEGHMIKECPTRPPMACNNCKVEGHMARDCPTGGPMACNYCKEEGHMIKDCPTRPPMACNHCKEEGHMAKDCPTRPPMVCTNCNQEGHSRAKCENARVVDRSSVPDATPDEAWNELKEAIKARDIDDVKDAIEKYSKACPEMTYHELQEGIFNDGLSLFLIAKERPLLHSYTNMDLQGNLNKKYSISCRFSDQPERPREVDGWPSTREELLARLTDAGMVVEQSVPHCDNCGEMGHIRKHCKEEPMGPAERLTIMCYNCNEPGHRMRDCPQPRQTRGGGACRNCGQPGHKASDCEEPRSAANVDCRKCGEIGHFSRDCPQGGGGGGKRACHTCGSEDHLARECPDKADRGNDFYTKGPKPEADDVGADQGGDGNSAQDGAFNATPAGGDESWKPSGAADW